MITERIAQIAHECNRAYCQGIGDNSQVPWGEAEPWQRESAIVGVKYAIEKPDVTPEQMHQSWVDHKLADGWEFGPVKDPRLKRHPCICPYDELPNEQKVKDILFRALVRSCMSCMGLE